MITSPLKAIRAKCLDCCFGKANEVKLCEAVNCPLHPFRFGKNPYRQKREISQERKEKLLEGLRKARESSKKREYTNGMDGVELIE